LIDADSWNSNAAPGPAGFRTRKYELQSEFSVSLGNSASHLPENTAFRESIRNSAATPLSNLLEFEMHFLKIAVIEALDEARVRTRSFDTT
jgi:hypothetical protein